MSRSRAIRSVNWRTVGGAIALSLCLTPVVQSTGAHATVVHASPALLQTGVLHPDDMVPVIVQKRGQTTAPEALIRSAGGKITKNLSIINAVAATIPGRNLRSIATSNSVNWLSADAPVHRQGSTISASNLLNKYDSSVHADTMWSRGRTGYGVNVAVVDSGVAPTVDLPSSRIVASVSVNSSDSTTTDNFGHGTHVAGIIAGDGSPLGGQYIGIAPKVGIVNVKVFNSQGNGTVSDVVNGLQWIYNNRSTYNIRIVNLSLNSTVNQSYNNDPLDAACEILWFNKVVVVTAAGNNGTSNAGAIYPPANDPFVITVGAVDDKGTTYTGDDTLASFSAYGATVDGFKKPDVVAPGIDLIAPLAGTADYLALAHPSHIVNGNYFDMSGTSMAAAVVSGAAALILSSNPDENPDQVKNDLTFTAVQLGTSTGTGAGEISVSAATWNSNGRSANTGIAASAALKSGSGTGFTTWDSASWGSASWGSVSWGSASWGSASWGSASWGSDFWGKTRRHPKGDASKGDKVPGQNG